MLKMILRASLAALTIAVAITGSSYRGSVASAQADDTIHVAGSVFEAAADVYYAQEAGFFARNGLKTTTMVFNSGAAALAAILGGSLNIGLGNTLNVAQARLRGIKVSFIAPDFMFSWDDPPLSQIVVAANSPIKRAKDLDGKTVAITSNPSIDGIAVLSWMAKGGGNPDSVKFIEIPPPAMGAAVATGRVDAALIGNPALAAAVEGGTVRAISRPYDAIAKRVMVSGYITTDEWAAAHPDEVRRFALAINQGAAWAVQNPEKAADVLFKYIKIQTPRVHEYHPRSLDPVLIQPMLDAAYRFKMISRPMTAQEVIWKP